MQGRSNLSVGSKINGLLEEYKVSSGGTINAGDFVKWMSKFQNGKLPSVFTSSDISISKYKAILLNDNKIFIAFATKTHIYALICSINNNSVEYGTLTSLKNYSNSNNYAIELTLTSDNKPLIMYFWNNNMNALLCEVQNLNVSVTLEISNLVTDYNYGNDFILLNNNKYILLGSGMNGIATASIINVSNNSITKLGNITTINGTTSSAENIRAVKIIDDTFAVVGKSFTAICQLNSDNTISILKNIATDFNGQKDLFLLSNNKIINIFAKSQKLYANILTYGNNELSIGNSVQLSTIDNVINISSVRSSGNNFFIAFSGKNGSNNYALYEVMISIDNNSNLTYSDTISLNSDAYSAYSINTLTNNDNVYILNNYNGNMNVDIYGSFSNGVHQLESNTDNIFGVAKIKGTDGQMVKVYVPNIIESESD